MTYSSVQNERFSVCNTKQNNQITTLKLCIWWISLDSELWELFGRVQRMLSERWEVMSGRRKDGSSGGGGGGGRSHWKRGLQVNRWELKRGQYSSILNCYLSTTQANCQNSCTFLLLLSKYFNKVISLVQFCIFYKYYGG